jgi:hypothetical protein
MLFDKTCNEKPSKNKKQPRISNLFQPSLAYLRSEFNFPGLKIFVFLNKRKQLI